METKKMNDPTTFLGWFVFSFFVFLVLSVVLGSFFTVNTAQVAVITRFGRFLRVANPGLNWKWPFIDGVAGRISLRVNQITLTMETKTKDNVFVTIPISVQKIRTSAGRRLCSRTRAPTISRLARPTIC
jgi:regulator of protease activity HflC (stomatin/prohibitin superfamily)